MSGVKNDAGPKAKQKKVKLTAYLSGNGDSVPPGTVISLDKDEADRLIGLGAAVEDTDEAGEQA
ncbi:hypothetical protein [Pseudaminobacter soli (ex Li et al. 2025)]|uniref:Uncharacterized protein n=1 Tax=Pseudaminobacter soli (ex Li et al. 2025) TaxID=1295366 RepID=A0A2P7S039_9HYPH|nr:hypothetical protein [Mesorhizobium soli]PSJ55803.1 hypothetical protein C7I85_26315 [Mesorhizobium soli]